MKNKCDIVQDLLPLYVDGCCTQSSRELVEEHLQECAACKQVFGEMTGDIPTPEEPQPEAEPVPAEPVPEEPEKKHEKTFRKGMKKIRRRWIASLIVVIILVPFVLMGIAQVTGGRAPCPGPSARAADTLPRLALGSRRGRGWSVPVVDG